MCFGDLTAARASWSKLAASLPDSTEKLSYRSRGAKGVPAPASDHFPASFLANTRIQRGYLRPQGGDEVSGIPSGGTSA